MINDTSPTPVNDRSRPAAVALIDELDTEGVVYELITHRPTMTALEEAAELGLSQDEVAKTIVLATDTGFVRAVLPASERLDLHRVRELLGAGKSTRLATELELAGAYPMFELGAVPPFGGPRGDRTIVDRRLAGHQSVVVEAGAHDRSVRMRMEDLLRLTAAEIADIREA
jgi:Ala-tRNA(Pro) deacylase